jgi:protein disulfide-isomerase
MKKQIFGISILVAALLSGCEREPTGAAKDSSPAEATAPAINLDASIARAKAENKLVLLDFTGSDWCPPCKALQKEVLSQPEFKAYAESNLIYHVVDFPQKFQLPPDVTATNKLLAEKFSVEGFPTLIALDGQGNQILRQLGLADGSPKELITKLDQAKQKAK